MQAFTTQAWVLITMRKKAPNTNVRKGENAGIFISPEHGVLSELLWSLTVRRSTIFLLKL